MTVVKKRKLDQVEEATLNEKEGKDESHPTDQASTGRDNEEHVRTIQPSNAERTQDDLVKENEFLTALVTQLTEEKWRIEADCRRLWEHNSENRRLLYQKTLRLEAEQKENVWLRATVCRLEAEKKKKWMVSVNEELRRHGHAMQLKLDRQDDLLKSLLRENRILNDENRTLDDENRTFNDEIGQLRVQTYAKVAEERGDIEMLRLANTAYEAELVSQREIIHRLHQKSPAIEEADTKRHKSCAGGNTQNGNNKKDSFDETLETDGDEPKAKSHKLAGIENKANKKHVAVGDSAKHDDQRKRWSSEVDYIMFTTRDYPREARLCPTKAAKARVYMEAYSYVQAQVKQGKKLSEPEGSYARRAGRVAECVKNCFQNDVEAFAASLRGPISSFTFCSKGIKHKPEFPA